MGGQHREIRQSGGARQQQLQATRQAGVVEIVFKAKPQHLGQVVIQRAGFEQVIGLLPGKQAGGGQLAQGGNGVLVENIRVISAMGQLQELGDEFQIDQPAGHGLDLPGIA